MKVPHNINRFEDQLLDLNQRQVRAVRHEAESVKNCFTNQAHQALLVSASLVGIMASILSGSFDPYVVSLGAMLVASLCLSTARVGCRKYNTANRVSAYQIHLSRVVDYYEANVQKSRLATELRRVDWEEAMFAWRVVQPKIFHFFYFERESLGICVRKFGSKSEYRAIRWISQQFKKTFQSPEIDGVKDEPVKEAISEYPWYDTCELLAGHRKKTNQPTIDIVVGGNSDVSDYHPGTYLRKKLAQLNGLTVVSLFVLLFCAACVTPAAVGFQNDLSVMWILVFCASAVSVMAIFELAGCLPRVDHWLNWAHRILIPVIAVISVWVLYRMFSSYYGLNALAEWFAISVALVFSLTSLRTLLLNRWRCGILESGLLSIQSSAFVWRIVCICHLLAKSRSIKANRKDKQIYNGYTVELQKSALNLRENIHRIHLWLKEHEKELSEHFRTTTRKPARKSVRTTKTRNKGTG